MVIGEEFPPTEVKDVAFNSAIAPPPWATKTFPLPSTTPSGPLMLDDLPSTGFADHPCLRLQAGRCHSMSAAWSTAIHWSLPRDWSVAGWDKTRSSPSVVTTPLVLITRTPFRSVTYTLPAESTATPKG